MTEPLNQPGDFNEELLSGYLDGELSSEEQAQVETAIHQDPQVRQLLDDLQQLRHCLQELPEEQPPENARQHVIEQVRGFPAAEAQAGKRSVSTGSFVAGLAALAAGIALLLVVINDSRHSLEVAQTSDPAPDIAVSEEAESSMLSFEPAGKGEMEQGMAMGGAMAGGSSSEDIPVVYVTVPAEAVDQISSILAANSIKTIDPSMLAARKRASSRDKDLDTEAAGFGFADDAAPGGSPDKSAAQSAGPQAGRSPNIKLAEGQLDGVPFSTMLVEGSPEKLAVAWEQIGQHKNTQLVQQAGPRLRGLEYDSNAFRRRPTVGNSRDNRPAAAAPLAARSASEKPAAAAGKQGLAQSPKDADADNPAAGEKLDDHPGPIVIRLIIQVAQ